MDSDLRNVRFIMEIDFTGITKKPYFFLILTDFRGFQKMPEEVIFHSLRLCVKLRTQRREGARDEKERKSQFMPCARV